MFAGEDEDKDEDERDAARPAGRDSTAYASPHSIPK
jgi:hypothetical protein